MEEFNPNTDFIPADAPVSAAAIVPKKKGFFARAGGAIGNFAIGAVKGAGDTLASVPRNIKKVGDAVYDVTVTPEFTKAKQAIADQNNHLLDLADKLPKDDPKRMKYMELVRQNLDQNQALADDEAEARGDYDAGTKGFAQVDKVVVPTNKAQSAGFGTEKVAEFFIPAGQVSKADKSLKGMQMFSNATKGGKVANAVARIGSRAALEGGVAGLTSVAQSGYQGRFDNAESSKDALKDAGTAAAVAGSLKGIFATAGELIKAGNIPKRLYNQVYKDLPKDGEEWFRNAGKSKPVKTTADWALEKNIRGPLTTQAKQVGKILEQSEDDVVNAAEQSGVRIETPPELKKMAVGLKAHFEGHGRGEIAGQIDDFIKEADKGDVSVKEGLKFRRFLDSLRKKTSFRDAKVGDDLAYWADDLREQVNNVNNIKMLNKDYAFAIKAKEALIKAALSTGNSKIIGAMEGYFEGGAAIAGNPGAGLGVIAAKRLSQSPNLQSNLAQGLNNLSNSSPVGVGIRSLIGKKASDLNNENFTQ